MEQTSFQQCDLNWILYWWLFLSNNIIVYSFNKKGIFILIRESNNVEHRSGACNLPGQQRWTYPYVLPNMPPLLANALGTSDKRFLTKSSIRTQFLQCLLDDIVQKAGWLVGYQMLLWQVYLKQKTLKLYNEISIMQHVCNKKQFQRIDNFF